VFGKKSVKLETLEDFHLHHYVSFIQKTQIRFSFVIPISGNPSNSKNKNIRDLYRDINEFKKGYHPRTNLVKDKRGDLLVDPHKILNRWKKYFCQLLNMYMGQEERVNHGTYSRKG
jgi:hypothetical protein